MTLDPEFRFVNPMPEALARAHEEMVRLRKHVMDGYCARLEAELRAAHDDGQDLAVSDFAPDTDKARITAIFLRLPAEGGDVPPGRSWTIYRSSRPLPADARIED